MNAEENATKSFTGTRLACTAVLFLLALTTRSGGTHTISPYDDAYHLKRIAFAAQALGASGGAAIAHGMTAIDFDRDRGVAGAFCPWPPLYDGVMGAAARVAGLRSISWVPPIGSALFIALMALMVSFPEEETGRTSDGHGPRFLPPAARASIVAALAIALSPYLIGISRVAAIDHHWVEPILVVAILFATLRRSAIGLAMAMTAALFVQIALIVACGLAVVALVAIDGHRSAARCGAIAFGTATAAVALYALTRPGAYPISPWFLGWPHAALLGAATLACLVAHWSARVPPALPPGDAVDDGRSHPRASAAARVAALAAGFVALLPFAPRLVAGAHFFAGDPWLQSIAEFQPMFRDPARVGTDLANLGGGVVALALAIVVEMRRPTDPRSRVQHRTASVTAVFAASYLLLAISSRRFLVPGVALFAIAGGLAAMSRRKWIAAAAVVLTVVPPLSYDVYATAHPEPVSIDRLQPLAATMARLASGRVLSPWHAGHAIDVFGRHAVVIDNFGSMPDATLFTDANRTLVESRPAAVISWCGLHRVRFLALLDPALHLPATAVCAGLNPSRYRHTPLAAETVWSRLWRGEQIAGFTRVAPGVWEVGAGIHE